MDIIQILKNAFANKAFFIRIYEEGKYIILWNDNNIKKKYSKKKLEKYLVNESKINEFVEDIIEEILLMIEEKYRRMKNRRVSVVIPNYNNEKFIVKCINSILANDYKQIEIVFVDDCSTDNSYELVKEKFGNNKRVKIFKNEKNSGAYYCRNKGILMADGYYVLNVDGDDFIESNMISNCVSQLEKINKDKKDNKDLRWAYGTHFQRLYIKDDIEKIAHINRSNSYVFLFYRKLFNMLGFYQDNRFGADSEYIKRAKWFGYNFYYNKEDIFYNAYTVSGMNLTQKHRYEERNVYINECGENIKKRKYIKMAFLENFEKKNKFFINMSDIKIGLVGLGFVGSAMLKSFNLLGCNVTASYDKFKNGGIGNREDLLKCDVLFSALPTMYSEELKEYNKQPLEETLQFLKDNSFPGIFVCKSTVEPGTCELMAQKYGVKIVHNPEFLTARTAFEDFHKQEHIVLGRTSLVSEEEVEKIAEFYRQYYKAQISFGTSTESESMKIFCNCFYSVKIQFFNEIYLTCQKNGSDYKNVVDMMLRNNWINPMHTNVPGPDGKLSYGGLCFPKDTNALNDYMKREEIPNKVLAATIEERNEMREDRDNCY